MTRLRIQQRREAAGISRLELAERCGWSENTIYRFEIFDPGIKNKNAREPGWGDIVTIAEALQLPPVALVSDATEPVISDEVVPITGPRPLANANIHVYQVMRTTLNEVESVKVGEPVYVDQSAEAIASKKSDDVLLISIAMAREPEHRSLMLLQFHAPMLVLTNRPGFNWAIRLDDPAFNMEILGVVMP